jgi:oxygen-dependent protoporphyrinogen oxidase
MAGTDNELLDFAIVGGGISGLAAAWRIHEVAPELKFQLFERQSRVGGILETCQQDGFLIEKSADSFITDQSRILEFCRRLGIENQLLPTTATKRRAYVVSGGRLVGIPSGFHIMGGKRIWPILSSPLLSIAGKLRLLCEPFIPRRADEADEESLAEFATRRLGREAFERLVQPLVGGIYTADADKLSVAAALPRFVEMEKRFGSISRGLRRSRQAADRLENNESGARYGLFVAPREGVGQLVNTLAARLPEESVRRKSPVTGLGHNQDGTWRLQIGDQNERVCRKLILATAAYQSAKLLATVDSGLAEELEKIPYASCAVVCLGFRREQFGSAPPGFGFVVPKIEKRRILAASFSSNKFPQRAPDDHVLVRVFMGGACQQELMDLSDGELVQIALAELCELLDITGRPVSEHFARWSRAMPQYHLGHLGRVSRIEKRTAAIGNLALIGNAFHGVGIPQCIETAQKAVERLLGRNSAQGGFSGSDKLSQSV